MEGETLIKGIKEIEYLNKLIEISKKGFIFKTKTQWKLTQISKELTGNIYSGHCYKFLKRMIQNHVLEIKEKNEYTINTAKIKEAYEKTILFKLTENLYTIID